MESYIVVPAAYAWSTPGNSFFTVATRENISLSGARVKFNVATKQEHK